MKEFYAVGETVGARRPWTVTLFPEGYPANPSRTIGRYATKAAADHKLSQLRAAAHEAAGVPGRGE